MSSKVKPRLELELGEKGGPLEFKTPEELQQWFTEENGKWQWMRQTQYVQNGPVAFGNLPGQLAPLIQQWRQGIDSDGETAAPIANLKSQIESTVNSQAFWLSSSEKGDFILRLKDERGALAAAAAYIGFGGTNQGAPTHPQFIDGVIAAFLFSNEIDWSATSHREALERLKRQYVGNISDQKKKAEELTETNKILNAHFSKELKEQKANLVALHQEQSQAFTDLVNQHEKNLKAIEEAYDQKLALLKPVGYWNSRRKSHNKKAIIFAIVSGLAGPILFGGLGWVAYELFLNIPLGEHPRTWQIGVFGVATFFVIWVQRILVRLFVSNLHLATDAEERVTMLQTYLSIIREGSEFAPEDKKLILKRLFHPATDGMVKDDGAPPTLVEMLSRK